VLTGQAGAGAAPDGLDPGRQGATAAFGVVSFVPPLLATLLAVASRRLVFSLLAAVFVGEVLRHGWLQAVPRGVGEHLVGKLFSPWHIQVLGFTCMLLGTVRVATVSGGAQAVVDRVCGWVRSARSTRVATVLLGCLVFFDDYANCMLVGPTMRPLSDRYRIAREKLAYLVDSTAAPVAGLVLVSTWVGYEAGLFQEVGQELGLALEGYALLFAALPFRFYCVFALVAALTCAILGRDFGPMLRAERAARRAAPRDAASGRGAPEGAAARGAAEPGEESRVPVERRRGRHAVLPILTILVGALGGFLIDGGAVSVVAERPSAVLSAGFWSQTLMATPSHAAVLFRAALVGALLAMVLPALERVLSPRESVGAFFAGIRSGGQAVLVLLSAWALAAVCKELGTGPTLIGLLGDDLAPVLVPVGTFLLAALIAFSTGSAFGTMAMLIPVSLPVAHATGSEMLLVLTAAAVLDGAIFGDHCSPISDTTMMSSIGAGSDHLAHVATQLPYALLGMAAALGLGYLPVAFGVPLVLCYGAGIALVFVVFRFLGRPSGDDVEPGELLAPQGSWLEAPQGNEEG